MKCKKIGVSFVASGVICYFCSIELQNRLKNMTIEREKRPLWYVMLLLLSVMPIVVWFVAYQHPAFAADDTMRFLLSVFPFYVFGMLAMAYYVYPGRSEVAWVLVALTWLSYAGLAAMLWLV